MNSENNSGMTFSNWEVESFRLTAFIKEDFDALEKSWWKDTVGSSPEKSSMNRADWKMVEQGSFEGTPVSLVTTPNRVDWILKKIDQGLGDTIPSLGKWDVTIDAFLKLANQWFSLDTLPSIQRIAFGSRLVDNVDSLEAGYAKLDKALHSVSFDIKETSDFIYQINRSRKLTDNIPGLKINRLAKWFVSNLITFGLSVGMKLNTVADKYVYTLELDINTDADYENIFKNDQLKSIITELTNYAFEISEKGDIK